MPVPFHPAIVHFPIALSFVLPILILFFALMIRLNKMSSTAWVVVIGLQVLTTATGYIALDSGEKEEPVVEKVLEKKFIQQHEETAEIFVGTTVLALVLSVGAFFLRKELQFAVQLAIFFVSLVSCYFVASTASLGGKLVYDHGAGRAYVKEPILGPPPESLLPTPGLDTSESGQPANESESLKRDENDYGNADEINEIEDEDSKQED